MLFRSVAECQSDWSAAEGIRVLANDERTNYPVTVSVDDLGEDFELTAQTEHSIYPGRVTAYVRTALESLVEALECAPETPSLALQVLPENERREVIETFNATQSCYPREKLIHELFEAQVARTPQAAAVVHDGRPVTFAELNRRANQLARYLRSLGTGSERIVAICVERSPEMVVGLLGILKAGAAYLPLDPNYPSERLQHMLEDAVPSVVLTQEHLRARLPATVAEVIVLDEKLKEIAEEPDCNPLVFKCALTTENLVYVIYTSGSTGRPKGTAMAHRSMVNLIEWHQHAFPDSVGKRVLQFAALSFDVAFQETFSTLCSGGTLVLPSETLYGDRKSVV